ncbi:TRAP transporter large permease subunit [Sulfitobacter mediterraneus]|uniref:TRAP transporter large permease n=1 Tax=Sulfitobacter mediterraneus TaxID=83219 RepID=UPI001931371B|nr:TRAP transporter large permease subunit [Sulfitobacter mediterraneus]MBM1633892.1 TRAP transporter large permease subunit [Sulfitobacter mediterraneus]MBM1641593.1 TRAP transporter large permease subunit [Sulfitobacter mediterraneus]MBM1645756.1 TRAP transporter large permease subunit [Sulfitobacter mediterraneus]MBM1649712.1 TRAP transporter large permease subunit [Sulfitobacter mediterraneus]MBM1653825.1 TRAP transporter large permease subunit [Sulfitobacter mediterraneus]
MSIEATVGLLSVVGMVGLIWLGLHVAVALALTSFLAVWALRGDPELAARLIGLAAKDSISSYVFGVIPLFVLMGLLVERAGVGRDAYDVAETAFRRIKGGLGIATVGANAIFAAITGVSIASAAVFTKVAVPQMIDRGYAPRFAVGVVAGSSVLGMLIPPSLLLIIYGVLVEVSIGNLFIAGVIPGLMLAVLYAIGILGAAHFAPKTLGAPRVLDGPPMPLQTVAAKLAPVVILIGAVFGGLYGGLFTPTEAGAVGALGALVIALVRRALSFQTFWEVLRETGYITAAICILFVAATMYSRMLALSGFPDALGDWLRASELGFVGIVVAYVALILVMGSILDSTSIMLICVPLFAPIVAGMGGDLVWFGIVTIIAVEIGLLTPPLGISAFVVKANLDDDRITLRDVFMGAAPFAAIMAIALALVIAFPALSLILVR